MQYKPLLSEQLKGFSQLQISTNYAFGDHTFSLIRLRMGLDLGKFQTGLSLDQIFTGPEAEYNIAPGVFFRMELY
ncbi:MAG: hypothetical protein Sapg2KO_16360 [Saprospiraceae bacterium]